MLDFSYGASTTVIVDDLEEKHVCNDEQNYVIEKRYNYDNEYNTYLLDRLCPFLIRLNGVNDVISIKEKVKLVC